MNDELRREINLAVGEIVRNATNFPEKVQPRLLGQDMGPLREAIVAKIEERIAPLVSGGRFVTDQEALLAEEERESHRYSLGADSITSATDPIIAHCTCGWVGPYAGEWRLHRERAALEAVEERRRLIARDRREEYAAALLAEVERGMHPVASVEVEFHDVSPEVMSLITGGIPLTDEDRIEAAARSIAGLEPGEPWPSNDDLGGHPMLGTRDDEYRDNIRDTARGALKAAGVIA